MILTIFGYPKTGKTLLFNLLTEKKEKISKFSTASNEFHKAIVDVPDPRLKKLADFFETPPVYAKIEYLDAGAISLGEVKNSTFIDLLRRADGLVHLVRAFQRPGDPPPAGNDRPGPRHGRHGRRTQDHRFPDHRKAAGTAGSGRQKNERSRTAGRTRICCKS